MASSIPDADSLVGRTIAERFAIEAFLQAGAMGAIYRARHVLLDKIVCVKVLHRELSHDPQFVARFHREAKAASRLDHPSSLRVLDFGAEPDGLLYIAMEYLDGYDLLHVIERQWPLSRERIVDLLSQTLAALAVAHEAGILHRDLKPENIMVVPTTTDDGKVRELVKVCDFGIAKLSTPERTPGARCSTQGIVGTPEYLSPEQARCDELDERSDLYSMGVILYHMLTGRLPFDGGGPVEIALKQIKEEPIAPSVVNPAVDPALEAVCLRALQKNRSDRWANAREMRAAIRSITPSDSVRPATPTTTLGEDVALELPARRPKARRRWLTPLVAGIAITTALVAGRSLAVHRSALATAAPSSPDVAPALVLARLPAIPTAEPAPDLPAPPPTTTTVEPIARPVRPPSPLPSPQRSVRTAPQAVSVETHVDAHASEPDPAPPPPVATQAPAPSPPPPPPPSPPAVAVVTPPPVTNAHVEIGGATQAVGATTLGFQRALAPATTRATACYRDALARLPAPAEGNGMLHVETNDIGVIKQARTTGALSNEVGDCIAKAVIGAKVPNVDTGNASADVPLAYRLR